MTDQEFWKRFAVVNEGSFFEGKNWYHDGVEISFQGLKIIFDFYDVWSGKYSAPMTRCYVEFKSLDNFQFKITNSDIVSKVKKLFGKRDTEIGRPDFDKEFIVNTNNEFKVKKILSNSKTREYLKSIAKVNIEISNRNGIWDGEIKDGNLQLSLYFDGKSKNGEELSTALKLFKEIISDLKEINSIS